MRMHFADDARGSLVEQLSRALATGSLILLALIVGEMMLASRAVELAQWDGLNVAIWPLAVGGVLLGFVVSRTRLPDVVAHLVGLFAGLAASLAYGTRYLSASDSSLIARVRTLIDLIAEWLRESMNGRQTQDDLVLITAMGLLLWLIGYLSTWFLFKRGWFLPAAILPSIPIALNASGIDGGIGATLLLYVLLALSLAAVQVARLRTASWQRSGLAFSTIAWRAPAIGGALIAVLAVALVWSSPVNPPESWLDAAIDQLEAPIEAVESAWDDLNRRLSPQEGSGEFAQFGDSFEMGGELNLSDQPVVLMESDRPHYLAAQRYDVYTGRGWESSAPQSIASLDPPGQVIDAPLIAFQPNQELPRSPSVVGARSEIDGTINVLTPTGNLIFTMESFSRVDVPMSATVSWRNLDDQRFDLDGASLEAFPVELRSLAVLLRSATFVNGDAGLVASDAVLNRRIESEVANLRSRFLSVRVSVGTDGVAVALFATGYVPNYDDVESIAPATAVEAGTSYRVSGWQSVASADQLRTVPSTFPDWVTSRYVQLPDTISQETRALAMSVAQGTTTTFDTALAIQTYLRATYPYEEAISGPPPGADAVHYFLFDEQQGYCEYFASAMIVMLRALDVPARMVSGLMEVPYDAEEQGYLYRQEQAHTWVEVFFDGYGWIPFEPTPSRGEFDYENDPVEQEELPTPTPLPVTPTVEPEPTSQAEPTRESPPTIATTTDDSGDWFTWQLGLIAASGIAIASGLFVLAWRYRRQAAQTSPGAYYYRRLVANARSYGVLPTPTTTPRELAEQVTAAMPSAGPPAAEISNLYRRELYGGQLLTPEDKRRGDHAVQQLRNLVRWQRFRRNERKGQSPE
jgi:hypothetical protein